MRRVAHRGDRHAGRLGLVDRDPHREMRRHVAEPAIAIDQRRDRRSPSRSAAGTACWRARCGAAGRSPGSSTCRGCPRRADRPRTGCRRSSRRCPPACPRPRGSLSVAPGAFHKARSARSAVASAISAHSIGSPAWVLREFERGEPVGQRRHRDLGDRLRGPAALAVHHAHRPHMAVQRQFAGALMEYLAVDVAGLLGGEKDA